MRERGLRLLGDEKALERWRRSRLFGPGRLSYEQLGCYPCHPPVEAEVLGGDGAWLLIENWTTFRSVAEAARSAEAGLGRVLYGGGNQLATRLSALAEDDEQPRRLLYFGDLDVAGLRIPLAAGAHGVRLGLPPLEPASGLYELLVEVGVRAPGGQRASQGLLTELRAWFGDGTGEAVADVLSSGARLAQEAVGVIELEGFDWGSLTTGSAATGR